MIFLARSKKLVQNAVVTKKLLEKQVFALWRERWQETLSFNFFLIPPKPTHEEAIRMFKQFDETGDVEYESVTSLV